ncbi:XRE family transcriptional regulator [Cognatiyoonia sp. IB215446]|uniref:XRE family transcriptional regulator n=1 Tax=Cognatiyoonia sp. IB215446 TaxID=3097355 RepID=UPI002A0FE280|nr:XRE family transcriptional regulator [Cognatiyoonia sp. IB215446]MDX8347022.1 XRE family transcriptional regulator [Cognatiyoonia sp. IB215446]
MLHKKGNSFHRECDGRVSASEYRQAISAALTQELGGAGRAAKAAMRWTGASERTVKNWISGSYGPTAEHMIELMRHSDTILNVVLGLAGRQEAMTTERIRAARDELAEVLEKLDLLCGSQDDK